MASAACLPMPSTNLTIRQGQTFSRVLRWEAGPPVFKAITGITKTAPAVVTCVAHGMPDGWRAAIVSVLGMRQINAQNDPPRASDFKRGTVVDVDTIRFNDINAAAFSPYRQGGYVRYNTPVPLTGFTARMSIKDRIGGTELLRLDTINSRIVIDAAACTITLLVDATTTAGLTWTTGIFDLEMVSADGVVTSLARGSVSVEPEVTTL
jgi:hypothetical protein